MWRDVIGTDPSDLNAHGSHVDKLVEFVKQVQRGLQTVAPTPLIDPALGVDLSKYQNFGERYYVDEPVDLRSD